MGQLSSKIPLTQTTDIWIPSFWEFSCLECTPLLYKISLRVPALGSTFHLRSLSSATPTPGWCFRGWSLRTRGHRLCSRLSQPPTLLAYGVEPWGWSVLLCCRDCFLLIRYYFHLRFFAIWRVKNLLRQLVSDYEQKQHHSPEWEQVAEKYMNIHSGTIHNNHKIKEGRSINSKINCGIVSQMNTTRQWEWMDDNHRQKHGLSWTQYARYCMILLKSFPIGKSSSRHSAWLMVLEVETVVLHGME